MQIKRRHWLIFIFLTAISVLAWLRFTYPQFALLDSRINRPQALKIAEKYLTDTRHEKSTAYQKAIVFISDIDADRYLQKTLGFKSELAFIKKNDFDLFLWLVRFFKENQKEEYRLTVSASTGQITSFQHIIDDTAKREAVDDEKAKEEALQFLKSTFSFDFNNYTFHSKESKKFDNRMNHAFSWEKNNIYIPWSNETDSGGAKLLTSATISGNEVLSFSKNMLDIPDKFNRDIQRQTYVGRNLSLMFFIIYIGIICAATFFVLLRRNHLAMHVAKNFCVGLTVIIFILYILYHLNEMEYIIFGYDTTSTWKSYLLNHALEVMIYIFLAGVAILMPSLAGESLHNEQYPQRREGSFLHYITSTFFSRNAAKAVGLGLFTAVIMMGIQSSAFHFGQKYLGVWVEYDWLTELSTTYLPFLSAFIVSFQASFTEEIIFRVFAINWLKKATNNIILAVILASVVWGFGHSHYLVFPMWFRGLEVSCMGFFLSIVYLNYGIIPVIVAHYTFDAFWHTAGYILGKSDPFNFYSSLFVLLLPILYGIIAFLINKPDKENELRWKLNKPQEYNLDILKSFLLANQNRLQSEGTAELRKELIHNGWDVAVVDAALNDYAR